MNLRSPGSVLLISCYELGHQPLGVAFPFGFLERAGFEPSALDISVEAFDEQKVRRASFVGICVPMHTALRLGVRVADRVRELNPTCHICCYGLYASLNSDYLLSHGVDSCLGGEYEKPLVALIESLDANGSDDGHLPGDSHTKDRTQDAGHTDDIAGVSRRGKIALPVLEKLSFATPSRRALPPLSEYAKLEHNGDRRTVGYVEASRGCLHLCTHCPIPPVYGGRFFVVPQDVVLEDIRRQVQAGATHITFGDPDFLNGPNHSLRVVSALHQEFPTLTFDFTAKVEHLLNRGERLPEFAEAGCLFIITAVESLSDRVLTILDKQHTHDDVVTAMRIVREAGIAPRPTWVSFTPWTTLEDFLEVLQFVETNDLIDNIDPVQYSVRLLIPPGSWLADHPETLQHRGPLDEAAFTYRWTHPDPRMDQLQKDIAQLVARDAENKTDAATTFFAVKELAFGRDPELVSCSMPLDRERAPRLTEPWFC